MKLGTVLSLAAVSGLALAQPALAATRSADSLPAVGTAKSPDRVGSKVRKGEKQSETTMTSGQAILIYGSVAAALALGIIIISDDDNDNIPDSP